MLLKKLADERRVNDEQLAPVSDLMIRIGTLVGQHYFNSVMNDVLDEYHLMLEYTE